MSSRLDEDINDKRSGGLWAAIALLLVPAFVATYLSAYFLRGAYIDESYSAWAVRVYSTDTEARLFRPAAKVESLIRQRQVGTTKPLSP